MKLCAAQVKPVLNRINVNETAPKRMRRIDYKGKLRGVAGPKPDALPDCATLRSKGISTVYLMIHWPEKLGLHIYPHRNAYGLTVNYPVPVPRASASPFYSRQRK